MCVRELGIEDRNENRTVVCMYVYICARVRVCVYTIYIQKHTQTELLKCE